MKRQIILEKTTANFEDYSAITFGKDDTLTLELVGNYDLSEAIIVLTNGKVQKSFRIKGSTVEVPQDLMFSGWLSVSITMYLKGEIVKKWQILPVKLLEIETEVTPEAIMQSFDEEITALKADKADKSTVTASKTELLALIESLSLRLTDLTEKHNKLTDIVKIMKEV